MKKEKSIILFLLVFFTTIFNLSAADLVVHFKKPSNYTNAYIYYWNTSPTIAAVTWPGVAMTDEGNGWYKYTLKGVSSANIIFNNKGQPQTPDLTRNKEGWYKDGVWYDTNPEIVNPFKVHFKKPANYTNVYIYYWNCVPAQPAVTWPGVAMTSEGNDWYVFTINANSANLIFNNKGTPQTPDLTRNKEGWYKDGVWYDTNPEGTTTPDTTPPTVSITAPANNATVSGTSIVISANATDNIGVAKVAFYYGTTLIGEDTTAPYSITWNTTLFANGTGALKVVATDKSSNTSSVSINVTINNKVEGGITVHYKNTKSWTKPYIYYWGTTPALSSYPAWPGIAMIDEGNGFFKYTIPGVTSAKLIFSNNGASQTADLSRDKEGWYIDGVWYDDDPNGPYVTSSPEGCDFWEDTIQVKIGYGNATLAKYTIDGSDPANNGISYTNNTTISIGSGMTIGSTKTLKLYATNGSKSVTKSFIFKKIEKPVLPTFSWNNATVYFVLTDRFYNGNPSNDLSYGRKKDYGNEKVNTGTFHGGDIAGLTAKLNEGYFTKLGVNAIWITAPYEQIHGWCGGKDGLFPHYSYHGYYVLDYTMMDKNMGTVEEFRTFVDTAHSKGIKVILDVVLNHVGYNTVKDMVQYNFGKWKNGVPSENWEPANQVNGWNTDSLIDYSSGGGWNNWWGAGWIRTGMYGNEGSGDLTGNVAGLPDVRTEETNNVGLPPVLVTKWSKETTGYDDWIIPAAKGLRKDLGISPVNYQIKWLAAWVREFGIDGFRCDTAKHVEVSKWAELKNAAKQALKEWRLANPNKPGANWTEDFWMTGEAWGHGPDRSYYYDNGFDSMINFNYMGAIESAVQGSYSAIEGIYSSYANMSHNPLSYISSHDTIIYYSGGKSGNGQYGFNRGNLTNEQQKKAGTIFLLNPKAVQIYYGDENGREKLNTGITDVDQMMRGDIKFGDKPDILAHWQKVGQFRNKHIAIGAGQHIKIADSPYTFARVKDTDKVVCVLGATGATTVNVSNVFADGAAVQDFYTGAKAVVSGGKVTFTADPNGVILIEKQ